ncbi:MAG: hypothetical protein AAGD14_00115 [Planctomycetota bacterium]
MTVSASDEGGLLRDARCVLLRAADGSVAARFTAPRPKGALRVRAGDRLLVYRRGYDVARVTCTEGQKSVDVTLRPASRKVTIVLQGVEEEDFHSRLEIYLESAEKAERRHVLGDHLQLDLRGARAEVTLPRGLRIDCTVRAEGHTIWPRALVLSTTQERATFHREQPWRPVLLLDRPNRHLPHRTFDLLPDFGATPPGPPERVDVWRWDASRPGWSKPERIAHGVPLPIAPPASCFVVATWDGRTILRRVPAGARQIDLSRVAPPVALAGVPVLGDRPAPEGSVVLPGRLDRTSVGALLDLRLTHPGAVTRVEANVPLVLAPSSFLTVWHPVYGLAHVPRAAGVVPRGDWFPATMRIDAPPGHLFTGSVAVFRLWRGTGRVRTRPPIERLHHGHARARKVIVRGLRFGWHGFHVRGELVHVKSGRTRPLDFVKEAQMVAATPHLRFELRAR